VLSERQAKADAAKKALAAAAKEEIGKFYAARNDRILNSKNQNRIDEKAQRAEMGSLMQFGAQWEKIGRLVTLTPKANEKRTVDRFRKLLLVLKNEKTSAAAPTSTTPSSSAAAAAADAKR